MRLISGAVLLIYLAACAASRGAEATSASAAEVSLAPGDSLPPPLGGEWMLWLEITNPRPPDTARAGASVTGRLRFETAPQASAAFGPRPIQVAGEADIDVSPLLVVPLPFTGVWASTALAGDSLSLSVGACGRMSAPDQWECVSHGGLEMRGVWHADSATGDWVQAMYHGGSGGRFRIYRRGGQMQGAPSAP